MASAGIVLTVRLLSQFEKVASSLRHHIDRHVHGCCSALKITWLLRLCYTCAYAHARIRALLGDHAPFDCARKNEGVILAT